jgi:hypothetical protein
MFTQEASNTYFIDSARNLLKRLGEMCMKIKSNESKFMAAQVVEKNMGANEMDFYRIQGMSVTFFNVLIKSEDHNLIFALYTEFMNELKSSRLEDTLFFPFIKNYAEAQAIDTMILANKLALVLNENGSNSPWFTEGLVKFKRLKQ